MFSTLASKSGNYQFNWKVDFDFESGQLSLINLASFGLSDRILDYVESGIPIDFKPDFDSSKIRASPDSHSIRRNHDVESKVISILARSGHVSPLSEKLIVLCPLM